eukprot:m.34968 g.34968  ORF g.34968 m.34968 type:complete len:111 (+) comp32039_c0_seq6:73-405(+)
MLLFYFSVVIFLALQARLRQSTAVPVKKRSQTTAHVEDGKLYYESKWFEIGFKVQVSRRELHGRYNATIVGINTGEVVLQRDDGGKTRLYVSQLQYGDQVLKQINQGLDV